jgi:restriction system protein
MDFIRQEELGIFLNELKKKPYGKFMVYGAAGMGKTTFLHMIENSLKEQGKRVVWIQAFSHMDFRSNQYRDLNTILLIDGLDEARYQRYLVEEIIKSGMCCICTSREKKWDINFDFVMRLGELSLHEIYDLIERRIGSYNLDHSNIEDIISMVKKMGLSPQSIMFSIGYYFKSIGLPDDFFSNSPNGMYQSYVYGKGIDLTCPKILIPEHNIIKVPKEIRNDIKVINKSLLDQIATNPEILYQLTSREFEEAVCELFERRGYRVKLTKQTRDGGKDIIILNHSLLGDLVFYAECKKYAKTRPVGVGLVRELYGTVAADRITAGILVTSSYFTEDAWAFRGKVKTQMNLLDYSDLIREIQNGII